MKDQVITIVLDGKRREVIARHTNDSVHNHVQDSNTFELLTLDGHPTDMYLKDVSETERADKYVFSNTSAFLNKNSPEIIKTDAARISDSQLRLRHMIAKLKVIKRLGIPCEPYIGSYIDQYNHAFFITRKVGTSIFQLCEKNIILVAHNAKSILEQIISIMSTLHRHRFIHNHCHSGNFTLLDGRVFLIDLASARRLNAVNWNSFDSFEKFFGDFYLLESVVRKIYRVSGSFWYSEDFLVFDFFAKLFSSYPCPIKVKYELLKRQMPSSWLHNGEIFIPPTQDVQVFYSHPELKNLRKIISKWKKEDPKLFPNLWLTEVHV